MPITPKNAVFEDDIHYPADSDEWREEFGGDFKYSGKTQRKSFFYEFSVLLFPYLTARIRASLELGNEIMAHTMR